MFKITQLVSIGNLALVGLLLSTNASHGLSFSLASQTGNNYSYTVTLDGDDSLRVGDRLILNNLSGVTNATANSPYTIAEEDYDSTSANFTVETLTNGSQTLTGVVSVTTPDVLDNATYQVFYADNGTPRIAAGNVVAVPFKVSISPQLGVILALLFWGLKMKSQTK